jgi:hypothetical protein
MENFRFTLFNALTLLLMVLTAGMALARAKASPKANWPLAYYALAMAFALSLRYSLNPWFVAAGAVCSLMVRAGHGAAPAARAAEFAVLAYVFARSVALLLMW